MRIWLVSVVSSFMLLVWLFTGAVAAQEDTENLLYLDLEAGRVVIEMRPDLAPKHVERIKILTREGFYDGLKFHRVLDGFVAQTGKPGDGSGQSDYHDLRAEFNRQPFLRGAVGMARNSDHPDTANSQFFICLDNSQSLDGNYTYWGHVIEGMKYVAKIKRGDPPRDPDIVVRMQLAVDVVKTGSSAPAVAESKETPLETVDAAVDDTQQLEAIEEQKQDDEQDDDGDWFDDLFGWIDKDEPESAASGAGGDEAAPQEIEIEAPPKEAAELGQKQAPVADDTQQLEVIEEQKQDDEQEGDGSWFDDLFGAADEDKEDEPESAAGAAGGAEAVPQEIKIKAPPKGTAKLGQKQAPAGDDSQQLEAIEEQDQEDDGDWFNDLFVPVDKGEPESAASGAGGDEAVPQEIEALSEESAEPEQKPAADEADPAGSDDDEGFDLFDEIRSWF